MSFAPEHRIIAAFVVGQISQEKADQLIRRTKAVNDGSLHVFFSDQRPQYEDAILKHFGRWRISPRTGKPGRPRKPHLEPHPNLIYAQVVKHRRQGKVVKVTERLIFGTEKALQEYLERSPVSHRINTSFVERQNNSLRQHNRRLTRKTLGFSKEDYWLERQLHLCIGYCHFCLPHEGLKEKIDPPVPTKGNGSPKKWKRRTPAMSAGVTDHVWSLKELLTYRLPAKKRILINY